MKKICTKCGKFYLATSDFFYKVKRGLFGLRGDCKNCCKEFYKQYQKTTNGKEVCNKARKRFRQTLKGHLLRMFCGINSRCNNPKDSAYKNYGGRGIENKFKSLDDFRCYVTDFLGITEFEQIKGLQIDRIDNDGDYKPGNMRFVTAKVNSNNRRNSKRKRNVRTKKP